MILLFSFIACAKNTKIISNKILNSEEYSKVLDNFLERANNYLETGDKINLLDDYIKNIENINVSQKALKDNYDKDREAFSLVEVAIFMKSSYSEGEKAKKLTDEDYEKMQKRFVEIKKFKELEQYMEIQPVSNIQ
ncbi:hypothetical protein [Fusobacterium polymorphum]|uniref:Uncharacterized protein n=1 Tax=Fusobacterium nucleatum subsp. polymorphum TaxID=76857 RepID=A0A2C5ZGM3_FUSNP|nr:hypothetical protein [Fusobacterium polymorphum]PHH98549.1 hypothetical protein CA836_01535 [Fusobacterium polymorphum]